MNDPTTASSYTWSKFTGKDGKDGTAGADSYVHFAYAQSADGSVNFSVVEYEGATHIGVYTDNVKEDSTDYKKYAWSQIRGEDGTKVYIVSRRLCIFRATAVLSHHPQTQWRQMMEKSIDHNGNELATNKWSQQFRMLLKDRVSVDENYGQLLRWKFYGNI